MGYCEGELNIKTMDSDKFIKSFFEAEDKIQLSRIARMSTETLWHVRELMDMDGKRFIRYTSEKKQMLFGYKVHVDETIPKGMIQLDVSLHDNTDSVKVVTDFI